MLEVRVVVDLHHDEAVVGLLDVDAVEPSPIGRAVNEEIETKNKEIKCTQRPAFDAKLSHRRSSDLVRELEAGNEAMKIALEKQSSKASMSDSETDGKLRDSIVASLKRGITNMEDMLRLVARLYPDRIIILDAAYKSAKESQSFKSPERALGLLLDLAGDYWEKLHDGKGDGEAKKVFGNSYAAREADTLKKEAVKRRTFRYEGSPIVMLKHLKIGVKDSVAETLRIHFEWLSDKDKIVIGHCGRHLKL
jgi:hypothetical protein